LLRVSKVKEGESTEILNVSGLNYSYDSKKVSEDTPPQADNFALSIQVTGQDIDDNKTYTISTNSFVASQFKKFFGDVDQQIEIKSTGLIDRDIIIEAVEKQKVINPSVPGGFVPRIVDLSGQE
jgi:2',3'-cyclic-nucleotide 2'-phosphodiesterase (5'-nucleotidase family)